MSPIAPDPEELSWLEEARMLEKDDKTVRVHARIPPRAAGREKVFAQESSTGS